jgi:hypothetical protein
MARALPAAVMAVVMLAGCGQASPPARALSTTTSRLSAIHSGELTMSLLGSNDGQAPGRGEGFELNGPFAVATSKGHLPVADLQFVRHIGAAVERTRFISTGSAAFLRLDSGTYRLPEPQLSGLRARGKAGHDAGLAGLDLDKWIVNPTMRAAGTRDGQPVVRITGRLDPIRALNDMLTVASGLGASDPGVPTHLAGDAAVRVRRAVRTSSVEVVTGRNDHLLREVHVTIGLAVAEKDRLRTALGRLAGVRLTMQIDVAHPNEPVRVAAPADSRPASELPVSKTTG